LEPRVFGRAVCILGKIALASVEVNSAV